ncbi:MAG: mitochondrial fission ELM1 family protein [Gammaproteobacteria bacterium]|nr:mitochondrial fission ELM1 family protein [Gammaproteobacteria bacterium]
MIIWTITAGKAGMKAQARGLARELLSLAGGGEFAEKVCDGQLARLLPASLYARGWARPATLRAVPGAPEPQAAPQMVIACGSRAARAGLWARHAFRAFAVYVQRPPFAARHFDAVVCPEHDTPCGGNVIRTLGSLGEVSARSLAGRRPGAVRRFAGIPAPRIALLAGGGNRAFSLDETQARRLARELAAAVGEAGGGILATPSRRTGRDARRALQEELTQAKGAAFFWDGTGENPYLDILAAADAFVVTGDSVNMLSEACTAAKPVYIWRLAPRPGPWHRRRATKFFRFHEALAARGLARGWEGALNFWQAPGLAETERAAAELWRRFRAAAGARTR